MEEEVETGLLASLLLQLCDAQLVLQLLRTACVEKLCVKPLLQGRRFFGELSRPENGASLTVGSCLAFNYELFDREKMRILKGKQYLCPMGSRISGVDLALLVSLNAGQAGQIVSRFLNIVQIFGGSARIPIKPKATSSTPSSITHSDFQRI